MQRSIDPKVAVADDDIPVSRRGLGFTVVACLLAMIGWSALGASPARAADETMPIGKVNPGMVGYAKTVTTGTVVTTFTVEIVSVMEGEGFTSGDLILFRASGPVIDQTGGIVPGMSGSPIYLTDPDDGREKVVGAISYGYDWAEPKLALATPIDEMLGLTQLPGMSPIMPQAPKMYAPADSVKMRPLGPVLSISGMSANSRVYRRLEGLLTRKGFVVTPTGGAGTARADVSTATLEPGASLGAGIMTGDTTIAGIGTVTYADGNRILGFGHPMFWQGPTQLYMMTGYVHTVFPAEIGGIGFKMASAGDTTGTVVQDRAKGIGGKVGQTTTETSITSSVQNVDDATSTVKRYGVAGGVMGDPWWGWEYSTGALLSANDSVIDGIRPGTADTTFTIRGRDSVGQNFQLDFSNKVSDQYDISVASLDDIAEAIDSLMTNGYEPITIDDISYSATVTAAQRRARIVNVSLFGRVPVKGKTMPVRVSLLPWGSHTRQAVNTTIKVPSRFYPAFSELSVVSATYSDSSWWEDWDEGPDGDGVGSDWSVQGWASDFENRMRNDQIEITLEDLAGRSVTKTIRTNWVNRGLQEKMVSSITMARRSSPIVYGSAAVFLGRVGSALSRPRVDLWIRPYGSSESTIVATTTGTAGRYLMSYVPTTTGRFFTRFPGDSAWLDAKSRSAGVSVRAKIGLALSRSRVRRGGLVTVSGRVRPAHTGPMRIQRFVGVGWMTIKSLPLDGSGRFSWAWRLRRRGNYVLRARWAGDGSHKANVSPTRTVRVT